MPRLDCPERPTSPSSTSCSRSPPASTAKRRPGDRDAFGNPLGTTYVPNCDPYTADCIATLGDGTLHAQPRRHPD